MKNFYITCCMIIGLGGCVTVPTVELDQEVLQNEIVGQPVDLLVLTDRPIGLITPGDAIGGVGLIAAMTRADGTKVGQPSTSRLLAQYLRERLVAVSNLKVAELPEILTSRPEDMNTAPDLDRYTLRVSVGANYLNYRSLAWTTYDFLIHARATLWDPDGKILWQKTCFYNTENSPEDMGIHRSEFAVDDGKKMKELIEFGVDKCAEQLFLSFQGVQD